MGLQSGVFRLFARGCHLLHTARTLHGEVTVRVSRGALSHPTHVKDLPPSKGISVRPSGLSLAILAYQANWLCNWDTSSYESSSNENVQRAMSGRTTRGLFADKLDNAVQTASVDRRATSAELGDTQVQPKT